MMQLTQRQIAKKKAVLNLDYTGGIKKTNRHIPDILDIGDFQLLWKTHLFHGNFLLFPCLK